MRKKISCFILTLFFLFFCINNVFASNTSLDINTDKLNTNSEACILMDTKSDKILYAKNAYEKMYPASTTKLMTAILTLENCKLTDTAIVSHNAIFSIPVGYSHANLQEGEELTIEQLLNVLLIPSANDAAIVLAEHISGSVEKFSKLMNEKAKSLGCLNTNFVNPNGIQNKNHYSTAYDLALIGKYALKFPDIKRIAMVKQYTLPTTNKYDKTDRIFNATNGLINDDVLNKNYSRPEIDKTRLGELVTLFTNLEIGTDRAKEVDMLGRVYEYFLSKFASAEGKNGGEFYTPSCIVRTLVSMIEPYKGIVYDPCCGSGGMFVQSYKFVKEHQGNSREVSVYGQELNPTTWKLAKMNLAIRQIEGNLGDRNADTFHNDLHKSLKANFILANPPFNISDWGGDKLRDDVRWKYGIPPVGNANYAWLQHMIHHLNPENGVAGTVLANGALASDSSGEGEIRKNMIEGRVVECIVTMPSQLFYATGIPCSLWIMRRNKK